MTRQSATDHSRTEEGKKGLMKPGCVTRTRKEIRTHCVTVTQNISIKKKKPMGRKREKERKEGIYKKMMRKKRRDGRD